MAEQLEEIVQGMRRKTALVFDRIFYSDEDVFQKNARKKEFENKYCGKNNRLRRFIDGWVPGCHFYQGWQEIKKSDKHFKGKMVAHAVNLGEELLLDAVRVGAVYGIYQFYRLCGRIANM